MQITDYHSQYFAYDLTRRHASDSPNRLANALVDAQVELNPHQVEAALFAFKSPLAKGALLADEVGLGKTIEAGLVISQRWAERSRRILVITPANLRKQWQQELTEKFFLPCRILETKTFNEARKLGNASPFVVPDIVICSYQFARAKASIIEAIKWDLVVMDEAHRLRNVYKPSNKIANTLKQALANRHKLLLTATPLQNSLLELYGLIGFIDEHVFGDLQSFREQFADLTDKRAFQTLKARIAPICHRTLRKQVAAYVSYTKRLPMLEEFTPEASEDALYAAVSEYLQRENLQALPTGQRALITLVLRKLLASSTFAIAGALKTMSDRLRQQLADDDAPTNSLEDELDQEFEALDEIADEWDEAAEDEVTLTAAGRAAVVKEIADLDGFYTLATSITENSKGKALIKALDRAFENAINTGAAQKALVFTESRRTQDYLLRLLENSAYKGKVVLFNGTNTDPQSNAIYRVWAEQHKGTDKVSGSKTADMRSALVDYFRDQAQIMIATEAGAEGINLQFCSVVVNYDLPWNPQRIEQRIGRCHRYGQKHDVVVFNFINLKNAADKRVYELLEQKFNLFEGVFGASDEVLGAIESGVDFEKRIAAIYQECRTGAQITAAFDQLQLELSTQIIEQVTRTRQQLLDNFDEDVTRKLKQSKEFSEKALSDYEHKLMAMTRHELRGLAEFRGDDCFDLTQTPAGTTVAIGLYELPRRTGEAHTYRLGHPLAEHVIQQARSRALGPAEITLDLTHRANKISALEPHIGQSGVLQVSVLDIESPSQKESHLICAAITDSGDVFDAELAPKLLSLAATQIIEHNILIQADQAAHVAQLAQQRSDVIRNTVSLRNQQFFEDEAAKLDGWADDQKLALEREIKDLDRQIKEARRAASAALALEDKLAGQRQVKELETKRKNLRRALFDAEDEIERRREMLIGQIQEQLEQRDQQKTLFTLRWRLI